MSAKTNAVRPNSLGNVRELTLTAMCIVLVYVFTAVVNIRLPIAANGGLIHLGNVPLFVAAILFGKRTGMIAGGVGMAIFDVVSGWTPWAPFTLVVVGLMGFLMGWITEKKKSFPLYILAMVVACVVKIVGYRLLHCRGLYRGELDCPSGVDPWEPGADWGSGGDYPGYH